jgi:hypothetical protein
MGVWDVQSPCAGVFHTSMSTTIGTQVAVSSDPNNFGNLDEFDSHLPPEAVWQDIDLNTPSGRTIPQDRDISEPTYFNQDQFYKPPPPAWGLTQEEMNMTDEELFASLDAVLPEEGVAAVAVDSAAVLVAPEVALVAGVVLAVEAAFGLYQIFDGGSTTNTVVYQPPVLMPQYVPPVTSSVKINDRLPPPKITVPVVSGGGMVLQDKSGMLPVAASGNNPNNITPSTTGQIIAVTGPVYNPYSPASEPTRVYNPKPSDLNTTNLNPSVYPVWYRRNNHKRNKRSLKSRLK